MRGTSCTRPGPSRRKSRSEVSQDLLVPVGDLVGSPGKERPFSGTMPVSQVVFRRDAQGNITGFTAGNGRARDIVFTKVVK